MLSGLLWALLVAPGPIKKRLALVGFASLEK